MEKNNIIVNTCSSSYQISSGFQPLRLLPSGPGETSNSSRGHQNPRKKRTKFIRNNNTSSQLVMISNPKPIRKPDPTAPKITRPCTECGRKFWSWKALFGHMRCHPEREWRGIVPPPQFRRSEITNDDLSSITEEDHEVADCLLMLANGPPLEAISNTITTTTTRCTIHVNQGGGTPEYSDDQNNMVDLNMIINNCSRFECSSCKKVFGSHQALGGHRASHKNVKGCYAITKSSSTIMDNGEELIDQQGCCSAGDNNNNNNNNNGLMGHKCSICFRVFSSGQALGGHMRCHWEKDDDMEEEPIISRVFGFDLNLAVVDQDDDFASYSSAALDLRLGL